ncbi:hypothetical protein [Pseudonocardia sp. MH-G8]|nr:hypothetical protein [Pseudonocardia sp. MH-G8]
MLAVRLHDPATVGVNSSMLSAMTLGTAAQLNLGNALLRRRIGRGRSESC